MKTLSTLLVLLALIVLPVRASIPATVQINSTVFDFKAGELKTLYVRWQVEIVQQSGNICLIDWAWKDGNHTGLIPCSNLSY